MRAELKKLKAEIAELRVTPSALLADVDYGIRSADLDKAMTAVKRITARYPGSPEAALATNRMAAFVAKRQAEAKEAERVASLGFKALKVSSTFDRGEATVSVTGASYATRWNFDNYGSGAMYLEPTRGRRFVTVAATFSSKNHDPSLPGLALYVPDGNKLRLIDAFEYRFRSWDGYGSYLGNESDYRNDFAHSQSIPFSLGATIAADEARRPIYIVATAQGCIERRVERFGRPPIQYGGSCGTLKPELTADDFKDGSLAVLKRMD